MGPQYGKLTAFSNAREVSKSTKNFKIWFAVKIQKRAKIGVFGRLVPIFTTRWALNPKVMGTIESGLSRRFFWHLPMSNQTNGYGDIQD